MSQDASRNQLNQAHQSSAHNNYWMDKAHWLRDISCDPNCRLERKYVFDRVAELHNGYPLVFSFAAEHGFGTSFIPIVQTVARLENGTAAECKYDYLESVVVDYDYAVYRHVAGSFYVILSRDSEGYWLYLCVAESEFIEQ